MQAQCNRGILPTAALKFPVRRCSYGHTANAGGLARSGPACRDPRGSAQRTELQVIGKNAPASAAHRMRGNQGWTRAGAPRAALSLVRIDAAITASPTTATTILHTAFISGLTPRRTSE